MPTHAGVNPIFELAHFPPPERQAIMRLAQHFYVTRAAKSVQIGNSSYRGFLVRPTDDMSAALNVEREILVLFANYDTFEARTLTAFDRVYEQFEDTRVDTSIRFLISADDNIGETIRHYLVQTPEYPIVVPFRYSEFRSPSDDFIYAAIRRNFLIRDLFGFQSPLKQEYFFFGRAQLLENVIDLHKSGQNSGLFGLRKSGKTSTIYAIQRRAKPAGCRTILIDCQDPGVHARRYSSLLELIIREIRKEFSLKDIPIRLGDGADEVSHNFRKLMNESLNAAGANILVIFDEIENISPKTAASRHWRNESDTLLFWQIVRSFFQSSSKHKITCCFVGTNPHLFEMPKLGDIDNPVYLFAPKTFIPMLSLAETTEMIRRLGFFMGLDFPPAVIGYIHQRFGGHPFFIRQLCSQIHRNTPTSRPRGISIAACKDAERDSAAALKGYMDEILNTLKSFYPEEYSMVEYLAGGEQRKFAEMADYDPSYVEHLIGYGLIVRRGDDYEFAFAAAEDAIRRSLVQGQGDGIEEKRQEISRRRNRIEEEMRSALYQWSMRLAAEEWSESLGLCLSKKRAEGMGRLTRQEAFSRNRSPLNFIELLSFINHSGQYEHVEQAHGSISRAMSVVNDFRIDAHAKAIDEQSFRTVNEAFNLLELIFVPPP